ncbi:MAG: sugar ABC transporter permease [Candidatus Methanomethylicaceae archaeon]
MNSLKKETLFAYLTNLPSIALLIGLLIFPTSYLFYLSFFEKRIGLPETFVSFKNYISVIRDPSFYKSLFLTLFFTIICVSIKLILGLYIANLLNKKFKGKGFIRSLIIIPWTFPLFVDALIWYSLYDTTAGALNIILKSIGLNGIEWLGPDYALLSIIIVNIWKGFPFYVLNFLAGMEAIPIEFYESAEIDSAGGKAKFLYITLPLIKYVIIVTVSLSLIWTFEEFETIYLLTRGGPGDRTTTIPILIYQIAFGASNIGYSSAIAIIALPIFLIIIYNLSKILAKGEIT